MSPLRGDGVLAIWNDIAEGYDAEFVRWHVNEHIPERLAVPGFRRARRYVAHRATPRYFNFYEVDSPFVLTSAPYLARLNDPTPRTQAIVPHFRRTSRTLCSVVASRGQGVGRAMITISLAGAVTPALRALLEALVGEDDVCAAHLLARAPGATSGTRESEMRDLPDAEVEAALLVEGPEPDALNVVVGRLADDALFTAAGVRPLARGLYCLDFMMDCPERAPATDEVDA